MFLSIYNPLKASTSCSTGDLTQYVLCQQVKYSCAIGCPQGEDMWCFSFSHPLWCIGFEGHRSTVGQGSSDLCPFVPPGWLIWQWWKKIIVPLLHHLPTCDWPVVSSVTSTQCLCTNMVVSSVSSTVSDPVVPGSLWWRDCITPSVHLLSFKFQHFSRKKKIQKQSSRPWQSPGRREFGLVSSRRF